MLNIETLVVYGLLDRVREENGDLLLCGWVNAHNIYAANKDACTLSTYCCIGVSIFVYRCIYCVQGAAVCFSVQ